MTDTAQNENAAPRASQGWIWPVIICALLGGQVLLMGVVYYIANTDPTFAVEPDYYQKGLDWDQHAAQDRSNTRLGWTVDFAIGPAADLLENHEFTCTLLNHDGAPLDGAVIDLTAFHHARGDHRLQTKLDALGKGRYGAKIKMKRDGLWEFRFDVKRGPEEFTHVEQRQLRLSGRTP